LAEKTFGSTSIDTMCVIDNNDQVIVNTNDSPFEIGQKSAQLIKNHYKNIDFLFVGYSSAGPYPQCFRYDEKTMKIKKEDLIKQNLLQTVSYLNLFKPKFYMPFAGKYVLGGKNWKLNSQRAVPGIDDAANYLQSTKNINQKNTKCILLNQKSNFDISTSEKSELYLPVNIKEKSNYIENVLSKIKYNFEEIEVDIEEILKLLPKCYERFEFKRKSMGFATKTIVLIFIENEKFLLIPFDGSGWKLISKNQIKDYSKYVKMTLDKKLLYQLLKGPKFAHRNNAEIGSHIFYERKPDIYERGLYYCINFFHE
jgi:UDP-MurNAc hydroxylase